MKGWSFIGGSRKAHYFDIPEDKTGGLSLCGGWMLFGANPDRLEDEAYQSPDNCKACMKKLKKLYPEAWNKDAEEYSYQSYTEKANKDE